MFEFCLLSTTIYSLPQPQHALFIEDKIIWFAEYLSQGSIAAKRHHDYVNS